MNSVLQEIARNAGNILLKYKERLHDIRVKSISSDVVSEADMASQDYIINELSKHFSDHLIVSEENYKDQNYQKGKAFLIDPLDGTLNYVHGFPFYAVSIARLEDGKVMEGVVYLPEYNEMFYAAKGKGSYLNGRRLFRKGDLPIEKSLVVTGWPYDEEGIKWTYKAIKKVNSKVQEIRILGSCASELCYLAASRLDGYFEKGLYPWDLAAGYLIATEAGIYVSSISTREFEIDKGEVVAGVKSVYEELFEIVGSV